MLEAGQGVLEPRGGGLEGGLVPFVGRIVGEDALCRVLTREDGVLSVGVDAAGDGAVAHDGCLGDWREDALQDVEERFRREEHAGGLGVGLLREHAYRRRRRALGEAAFPQLALYGAQHAAAVLLAAARFGRARESAEELLEDGAGEFDGEEVCCDVLEAVGLIEDEASGGGEEVGAGVGGVGQDQRVVGYDEMRLERARAGLGHEAFRRVGAGTAEAVLAGADELGAEELVAEVVEVAVRRGVEP